MNKKLEYFLEIIIILSITGCSILNSEKEETEKYYTLVDIGCHIDSNGVTEEKLSKNKIKDIFQKETILRKEAFEKYEKLRNKWFENNGNDYIAKFKKNKIFHLDRKNHPISANVYEFSKSKAKIHIKFIYGHSRWHHYYIALRDFSVDRDSYIDEVFNLIELENKYSYSFKGGNHGMYLEYVKKILGNDYYRASGQSPQYQKIYYDKYNIEIIIQDWVVKYLQKGRPTWMDTKWKYKNKK